jgi:hypothetical protein
MGMITVSSADLSPDFSDVLAAVECEFGNPLALDQDA